MSPIDQSRPFEQRLNDFGPELGQFLGRVWRGRAAINLKDFDTGVDAIYDLYSGVNQERRYSRGELEVFLKSLTAAAGKYPIYPQGGPEPPWSSSVVRVHGRDLWGDFFHVLSSPAPARSIRSRVYVHAANPKASVGLMSLIIKQFGVNRGLWEAKTAGPGSQRLDTIVCYLYDAASADQLVEALKKAGGGLVTDSLPPLVKRAAPGIGLADEPPAIEIYRKGGTRHSFGSFFSSLCWVALKATPDIGKASADGRHMLDNMLHSLRLLRVDPRNPQRFPESAALEAWYQGSVR